MSEVAICNQALSHLGSDAQVVSIDPPDGSQEAGYCARFFRIARREMIELHAWGFATRRALLAALDVTPPAKWLFTYAVPGTAIKVDAVLAEGGTEPQLYEIENGKIYTNAPGATAVYKIDVLDTSKWPPAFANALSYLLASYLAGPIVRGREGAQAANAWREAASAAALRAAASDANNDHETHEFTPFTAQARQ